MATISEDYVSFEIAKLLKDKGFCEPCFAYYSEYIDNWKTFKIWKKYPKTYDTVRNNGYVLTPTLQMAMKWLREVHKIHIVLMIESNGNYIGYLYDTKGNNMQGWDRRLSKTSYEEACEAAVKCCLENLI